MARIYKGMLTHQSKSVTHFTYCKLTKWIEK